ncbi:cation:dicarboxylase symporter family transporter [Salmonella enterica subsp. enterica]|nr:cation:dicarboxylase symporter family transporter [Salmonella enterica subsp. enterica]
MLPRTREDAFMARQPLSPVSWYRPPLPHLTSTAPRYKIVIAAIFTAQLYGTDLSLWQEIVLVLTLMVTSKVIAGVPGVSFVVCYWRRWAAWAFRWKGWRVYRKVLSLITARTALNVVGNALAVLVIAKWEQ